MDQNSYSFWEKTDKNDQKSPGMAKTAKIFYSKGFRSHNQEELQFVRGKTRPW